MAIEGLDFSSKKIESLQENITQLKNVLSEAGFDYYNSRLTNILAAALQNDEQKFRKYAIDNEIFGGAGALWEIAIFDEKLRERFEKYFAGFVNDLKKIGLKNKRIDQIASDF